MDQPAPCSHALFFGANFGGRTLVRPGLAGVGWGLGGQCSGSGQGQQNPHTGSLGEMEAGSARVRAEDRREYFREGLLGR
jgi:hypothetical protein